MTCENCGQPLEEKGGLYVCRHCGATYQKDRDVVLDALDDIRAERLANARRLLYSATHAKYPSREAVISAARDVLSIYQDEPLAEIYLHSHDQDPSELVHILAEVELDSVRAQEAYRWLLPSLTPRTIGPVKFFVERHFKDAERTKRLNEIEKEAAKIAEGIYVHTAPRDVFLCYSSADMPKVVETIDILEANGFTVFAAFRNMRHGKGAKENYQRVLREAMTACKSFVFISTDSARSLDRDTMKEELPYLTAHLPSKRRVEFVVNDYSGKMPILAKQILKDAFPHQEQVREEEELVLRVNALLRADKDEEERKKREAEEAKKQEEERRKAEDERKAKEFELERQRIELEKERLAIEREKLALAKAQQEKEKEIDSTQTKKQEAGKGEEAPAVEGSATEESSTKPEEDISKPDEEIEETVEKPSEAEEKKKAAAAVSAILSSRGKAKTEEEPEEEPEEEKDKPTKVTASAISAALAAAGKKVTSEEDEEIEEEDEEEDKPAHVSASAISAALAARGKKTSEGGSKPLPTALSKVSYKGKDDKKGSSLASQIAAARKK